MADKVIWQSKIFPKLVMTDVMLESYKKAFTRVKEFKPHMVTAEAWLVSNPLRVPSRNWKGFVFRWMNRVNKWAGEPKRDWISNPAPAPRREKSFSKAIVNQQAEDLRKKLNSLPRGSKEYIDVLQQLKQEQSSQPLGLNQILKRVADGIPQQ